jgi:cysteine dioxygenase
MKAVSISSVIDGLTSFSDADFTGNNVYEFLGSNPIDVDSITKYFHWSPNFYTRNLIYRDERFEMMAICWEEGQKSVVHNHAGQNCWMTVPVGKLLGQNFAVEQIDESKSFCKLVETDTFELSNCLTAKVELEQPIHQILNLPEFGQRAVSVHIYSRPIERCLAYCRETDTFKEVELCYTSIDGKLINRTAN